MFVSCPLRGSGSLRRVSVRLPSPKGSSMRSLAGVSRPAARSRTMPDVMQVKISIATRMPRLCFSERPSRYVFSLSLAVDFISIFFRCSQKRLVTIGRRYLSTVRRSLFSTISKCSARNPCGLLSERTVLCRRQRVTRERSVMLLPRMIICRA